MWKGSSILGVDLRRSRSNSILDVGLGKRGLLDRCGCGSAVPFAEPGGVGNDFGCGSEACSRSTGSGVDLRTRAFAHVDLSGWDSGCGFEGAGHGDAVCRERESV